MKMTERFTRLNNDFLIYTITVDDPVVLTHSWTARFPLKLDNSFQILEYACTEDNNMIPHWISMSRVGTGEGGRGAKGTTLMKIGSNTCVALGTAAALAAISPSKVLAAISDPVKTSDGQISGVTLDSGVRAFKGIPFAAPPLGDLRWKQPQPAAHWEGVRKADAFGDVCVQPPAPKRVPNNVAADLPDSPKMSEDCLYLNVWTDAKRANAKLPVMVWIYGGAYTEGAGSSPHNDGEDLARKGVVLVTFNYRLGPFGFFSHPELTKESGHDASGNQALGDSIATLQWVQQNIRAFGGDPNNVTIFGQSAGACMVAGLVGSPVAKGLFHRAIAESGQWMGLGMAPMTPLARAEKFAALGPPRFGPPGAAPPRRSRRSPFRLWLSCAADPLRK